MGLSKQLLEEESSYHTEIKGSLGWQPKEVIMAQTGMEEVEQLEEEKQRKRSDLSENNVGQKSINKKT